MSAPFLWFIKMPVSRLFSWRNSSDFHVLWSGHWQGSRGCSQDLLGRQSLWTEAWFDWYLGPRPSTLVAGCAPSWRTQNLQVFELSAWATTITGLDRGGALGPRVPSRRKIMLSWQLGPSNSECSSFYHNDVWWVWWLRSIHQSSAWVEPDTRTQGPVIGAQCGLVCSGRLKLVLTDVFKGSTTVVDAFHSREDLINACLASSHIPFALDGRATTKYRYFHILIIHRQHCSSLYSLLRHWGSAWCYIRNKHWYHGEGRDLQKWIARPTLTWTPSLRAWTPGPDANKHIVLKFLSECKE